MCGSATLHEVTLRYTRLRYNTANDGIPNSMFCLLSNFGISKILKPSGSRFPSGFIAEVAERSPSRIVLSEPSNMRNVRAGEHRLSRIATTIQKLRWAYQLLSHVRSELACRRHDFASRHHHLHVQLEGPHCAQGASRARTKDEGCLGVQQSHLPCLAKRR